MCLCSTDLAASDVARLPLLLGLPPFILFCVAPFGKADDRSIGWALPRMLYANLPQILQFYGLPSRKMNREAPAGDLPTGAPPNGEGQLRKQKGQLELTSGRPGTRRLRGALNELLQPRLRHRPSEGNQVPVVL